MTPDHRSQVFLLVTLSYLSTAAGAQQLWRVGPTGDFASPAAALASTSVAPGDRLLVEAGTYPDPLVIDRPITIVAEPGELVRIGPVHVTGIPAMGDHGAVRLRGLRIWRTDARSEVCLDVDSSGSPVWLEDCDLRLNPQVTAVQLPGVPKPTVRLRDDMSNGQGHAPDVTLSDCVVSGSPGSVQPGIPPFGLDGGAAIEAGPLFGQTDAKLTLFSCVVEGGRGGNQYWSQNFGGSCGGDGIRLQGGCYLVCQGCTIVGGDGGDGRGTGPNPMNGGDGGNGLVIEAPSFQGWGGAFGLAPARDACLLGTTVLPGHAGQVSTFTGTCGVNSAAPQDGVALDLASGVQLVNRPAPLCTTKVDPILDVGQGATSYDITVNGTPGAYYVVYFRKRFWPFDATGPLQSGGTDLLLGSSFVSISPLHGDPPIEALGNLDGTGQATATVDVPWSPFAFDGTFQVITLEPPPNFPTAVFGTPSAMLVVH